MNHTKKVGNEEAALHCINQLDEMAIRAGDTEECFEAIKSALENKDRIIDELEHQLHCELITNLEINKPTESNEKAAIDICLVWNPRPHPDGICTYCNAVAKLLSLKDSTWEKRVEGLLEALTKLTNPGNFAGSNWEYAQQEARRALREYREEVL